MAQELDILGIRLRTWICVLGCLALVALLFRPDETPGSNASPSSQNRTRPKILPSEVRMNAAPATFASNPGLIERATILQGLSDPDAEKRLEAAKRLDQIELGRGELVAHLIACLRDADAKVRAHAAVKLGMMRLAAMDAVPALKEVVKEDSDENVRSHAKDALYNIRGYDHSPISIQLD